MIQYFAFFVFSSSQPDNKYITQQKITAKTAITAINLVNSEIIFVINFSHAVQFCLLSHQGNPSHPPIVGHPFQFTKFIIEKKIKIKIQIYLFIIKFWFNIINI
jgi:hypothetical protein